MYANLEADMDEDPDAESRLEAAAAVGHLPARYLLSALRGEEEFPAPDGEEFREMARVTLREAWRGNPEAQFSSPTPTSKAWACPRTTPRPCVGCGRRPNRATRPQSRASPPRRRWWT